VFCCLSVRMQLIARLCRRASDMSGWRVRCWERCSGVPLSGIYQCAVIYF